MITRVKIYPSKRKIFLRILQAMIVVSILGYIVGNSKSIASETFASFLRIVGVTTQTDSGDAVLTDGATPSVAPSAESETSVASPTQTTQSDSTNPDSGSVYPAEDLTGDNSAPRPPEPSEPPSTDGDIPPEPGTEGL